VEGWGNTRVARPEGAPCPYHNHILQNLVLLYSALETIDKMKHDIERLMAFVGMEPEAKGKKKEKRRDEDEEGVNE